MEALIIVKNQDGRAPWSNKSFAVRVVKQGERFGHNLALTHDRSDPLVEFYDYEYAGKKGFTELGQFVSRYNLITALDVGHGLDLAGGVPEWKIDDAAMAQVRAALLGLARNA